MDQQRREHIAGIPGEDPRPGGSARYSGFFRVATIHAKQLLWNPSSLGRKLQRVLELHREGGWRAITGKIFPRSYAAHYAEWVARFDTLDDSDRDAIRAHIDSFAWKPRISVIMPVHDPNPEFLKQAIDSVRSQLYQQWELCIADDASQRDDVRQLLAEASTTDDRITVVFREGGGHISVASNSALKIARGEFVAFLDHDDCLAETALYHIVNSLQEKPDTRILYSDEDKLCGTQRRDPHCKPEFSRELLLSQNYFCHLLVMKRALVEELGGFRVGLEGAQDWDLVLRAVENSTCQTIEHIPYILYHWRMHSGSTASSASAKDYVGHAQVRAVGDILLKRNEQAEVSYDSAYAQVRVRFKLPEPPPLVSMIIPTRNSVDVLRQAVRSCFLECEYPARELIIVDNGSDCQRTLRYFAELSEHDSIRVLKAPGAFNFSRLNNQAVAEACGSVLVFCNNDLEARSPDWLAEMVALACRDGVGAVGARLLYPDNRIQHAGVVTGIGGVAGHAHKRMAAGEPGYHNRAVALGNFSAVTAACLVVRKELFETHGGFDEENLGVAFNDVDFCLKLQEEGYRNVYTPNACLIHHESVSRGDDYQNKENYIRFEKEHAYMRQKWGERLKYDPYYNPNLTLEREDFSLSFNPRAKKPWLG